MRRVDPVLPGTWNNTYPSVAPCFPATPTSVPFLAGRKSIRCPTCPCATSNCLLRNTNCSRAFYSWVYSSLCVSQHTCGFSCYPTCTDKLRNITFERPWSFHPCSHPDLENCCRALPGFTKSRSSKPRPPVKPAPVVSSASTKKEKPGVTRTTTTTTTTTAVPEPVSVAVSEPYM